MRKVIMLLDNCFDPDIRVYKEAKYLVDKGIEVEIVCLDKKNKYIDRPEEIIDGIKIKRFFVRTKKTTKLIENKIGKVLKPLVYFHWLLKFMRKVRKYLRNIDFSTIHCHDITMAFCATHYIKHKDIVFDMHEYYEQNKNKIMKKIMHHIVSHTQNKAKWIIHVNEFQTFNMNDKNKQKLIEIPNYPEIGKFNEFKHIDSDKLRISYTGILRHKKPLENLVIATADLDNVEISFNGRGDVYEYLKDMENKYSHLRVTGEYNHNDVAKFYANSDLIYIVYNNDSDNDKNALPTKLYEAVIAKIPMIVSVDSKMEDFIKKYDIGFSVNGKDVDDINKLIKSINEDREILEQKKNNISKIQYDFTWDTVVKNLDKIYIIK